MSTALSVDDVCRFVEKVDRSGGPDACWPWKAARDRGYGRLGVAGRTVRAHRIAYMIANDADPGALCVCHRCDNRKCCNPAHLFLGTNAENTEDMMAKGRGRQPRGSAHPRTVLTEADVLAIRTTHALGGVMHQTLAVRYGISRSAALRIVHRQSWKHVGADGEASSTPETAT